MSTNVTVFSTFEKDPVNPAQGPGDGDGEGEGLGGGEGLNDGKGDGLGLIEGTGSGEGGGEGEGEGDAEGDGTGISDPDSKHHWSRLFVSSGTCQISMNVPTSIPSIPLISYTKLAETLLNVLPFVAATHAVPSHSTSEAL